jgi:hypothetical protein
MIVASCAMIVCPPSLYVDYWGVFHSARGILRPAVLLYSQNLHSRSFNGPSPTGVTERNEISTQDRTNAKRTNDTETLTRGKAAHQRKPRDTDAPRSVRAPARRIAGCAAQKPSAKPSKRSSASTTERPSHQNPDDSAIRLRRKCRRPRTTSRPSVHHTTRPVYGRAFHPYLHPPSPALV